MKSFEGAVVLITGAGSGIGRALAEQFAQAGARLALADVNAEALEATAARLRDGVVTGVFDVADGDAFRRFVDDAAGVLGPIDVLVNNAGIGLVKPIAQTSRADLERVMAINFWGVVNGTQAVLPAMLGRDAGVIVNISSLYGLLAWPNNTAYCAAKFAVRGYTEALSQDLHGTGVKALCVHPGGIRTNIVKAAAAAGDVAGTDPDVLARSFDKVARTSPEQAARTIINGIRRGRARIVIGADAKILESLQRLLPVRYRGAIRAANRLIGIA